MAVDPTPMQSRQEPALRNGNTLNHSNPAVGSPIPRIAWVLCGFLFVATALSFLDRQVLALLNKDIKDDLHLDTVSYSQVVATFTFAYTLILTGGGWLVDRVGIMRGLGLSVLVWSLACAGHALAQSAFGLGVAMFFLGLGEGPCFPAAAKAAAEWFPPEKRGKALGIAIGGSAFGAMLAPPMVVGIAGRFGWRGTFIATGIIGLIWVAGWFIAGRFVPAPVAAAGKTENQAQPEASWREVFRQPAVWRILAARLLFDPVLYFYMFWVPKFLTDEKLIAKSQIAKYYWLPYLALGVSNIASGYLSDGLLRLGWPARRVRGVLLAVSALSTVVLWGVIFAPNFGWMIALMAVYMVAHGLWIFNYIALISEHFPSRVMATVVGLTGTIGGGAAMLASLAIGRVVTAHSYTPVFICAGLLYPLAFLVLMTIPRPAIPAGLSPCPAGGDPALIDKTV